MKVAVPLFSHPKIKPFAAIICIFLGGAFGCLFPQAGLILGPIGDFFISLLKMCALPLVITMILESFYRLNQRSDRSKFIFRTFRVFGLSVMVCATIGVLMGFAISPLVLNNQALLDFLSQRMASLPHFPSDSTQGTVDSILKSIPQNIFKALSEGQIVSCLIFFGFLGTAIAKIPSENKHRLYESVETLKEALFWMLSLFTRFVPIAMFAIFASLFSKLGADGATVVLELVAVCLIPILFLNATQWMTLYLFRRKKFNQVFKALKSSLLIAFGTNNSMVALPSAMNALGEKQIVEEWVAETIMPLSITFNAQAFTVFYAFIATLSASIYGLNLRSSLLFTLALGGIMQGICASGLPGLVTLGTIPMIFGPLGVPVDLIIAIVISAIPFMTPFLATTNLLGYSWSAIMVERRSNFRNPEI